MEWYLGYLFRNSLLTKHTVMKKILMAFVLGVGLVACGDNATDSGNNGGALDSNVTMPPVESDNSTLSKPDTSAVDGNSDSAVQKSDTGTLRSLNGGNSANGAGGGNSSGQGSTPDEGGQGSGQSTNSNNSGSAGDDETNGSK
jgi:hypothetical protein